MTIPTSERNKWHRGFASFNPTCSLIIILTASDKLNFHELPQQICLVASIALGLAIRFSTKQSQAPTFKIMCAFQLASFFMSMTWVYLLCDVIVELLELFGIITGLPSSFLGLTVLSWGNSLGDYFASISISKRGFGEMAITGCMAGPVFNLMLGLGLTTLICNLRNKGGIVFNIHASEGLSSLATVLITLFIAGYLAFVVITSDFKIDQKHAKVLIGVYSVSIILIAIVTLC